MLDLNYNNRFRVKAKMREAGDLIKLIQEQYISIKLLK